MRLRVFRDKKGRVIATVEEPIGKAVTPEPVVEKSVTVERISGTKDYMSQLHVFYKSAKRKPKSRKDRIR